MQHQPHARECWTNVAIEAQVGSGAEPGRYLRQLFVRNIPAATSDKELCVRFAKYGDLRTVNLKVQSRGIGFFVFYDIRAAVAAKANLDGIKLHGSSINITFSDADACPEDGLLRALLALRITARQQQPSCPSPEYAASWFDQFGDVYRATKLQPTEYIIEFCDTRAVTKTCRLAPTTRCVWGSWAVAPVAPGTGQPHHADALLPTPPSTADYLAPRPSGSAADDGKNQAALERLKQISDIRRQTSGSAGIEYDPLCPFVAPQSAPAPSGFYDPIAAISQPLYAAAYQTAWGGPPGWPHGPPLGQPPGYEAQRILQYQYYYAQQQQQTQYDARRAQTASSGQFWPARPPGDPRGEQSRDATPSPGTHAHPSYGFTPPAHPHK